jgi:hypothetical protein
MSSGVTVVKTDMMQSGDGQSYCGEGKDYGVFGAECAEGIAVGSA